MDAAHLQWVINSRQQNATRQWNIYAIPKFINLSISIWAERCIQMKKIRLSPEHEIILNKAKNLLNKIRTKSIVSSYDYNNLHTSNNSIETYTYDTLVQLVRSVEIATERHFLSQNYNSTRP